MKTYTNLFDSNTLKHFSQRLNQLTPTTQPKWGQMNVAQMLAHCSAGLQKAMSTTATSGKRSLKMRIIGTLFKSILTSNKPFRPGTPTSPEFVMVGSEKDFETEKKKLLELIETFSKGGPEIVTKHPHALFGKLTADEWNKGQCKHLNHHLTQFGV
jgi:hypothetical protein